jgi:hypothetical protein
VLKLNRIIVTGLSAEEMLSEINNPQFSKKQLDFFRKCIKTNQQLKSNTIGDKLVWKNQK